MTGQLTALTRLGTLGHLDLQLIGIGQVMAGHTKATGGHLLDTREHGVAIFQRLEADRVFTTLTTVALAAQAVHGHGQGGVRFPGNRTKGHGAGGKALENRRCRLYLVQRNRLTVGLEVQQTAQGKGCPGLIVHAGSVLLEHHRVIVGRRMLQQTNGIGAEQMPLTILAPAVITTTAQNQVVIGQGFFRIATAMLEQGFTGDFIQPDPFDTADRTGKAAVNHCRVQAQGFKNLRTLIGLQGRDPHLGEDFQQATIHALGITLDQFGIAPLGIHHALVTQFIERLKGHIGIDRCCTIAQQGGKMMGFPHIAGLHHNAGVRTQPLTDQKMVHSTGSQQ